MPDRIILPEGCQHFPTGVGILHISQGDFNSSIGGVAGAARRLCPPQAVVRCFALCFILVQI